MRVPQWLSLLVAAWVILFGLYRLKLAFDPRTDLRRAEGKKGIFNMKRTTQGLLGVIYVLMGGALVATSFGWNPLSGIGDDPAAQGSGSRGSGSGSGSGSAKGPHAVGVTPPSAQR